MSQVANLEDQLRKKRKELLDCRAAKAGVKVGDVVVTDKGRFRVAHIQPWSLGVDLKVNSLKKDGTWGERVTRLFDKWTVEKSDAS
ncbi:hypothetical protein AWB73_00101 [Caballeronia turbans]|nr:hypothetical protein AWB73_00101 [Caballeronia turbans]